MSPSILISISFLLLLTELFYFYLARKLSIKDIPNHRSSHQVPIVRGGGIIFSAAVFFVAIYYRQLYFFSLGLFVCGIIHLLDDIRSVSIPIRFAAQIFSSVLIIYETGLLHDASIIFIIFSFLISICILNACNFMDGINGMIGFYSLSVIIPLFISENTEMRKDLELVVIISLLIFLFFNARVRAKTFAGDVGSIGIGLIIVYLLLSRIMATGNYNYLGFILLAAIDTGGTLLYRIYKHEPILKPHRTHLYQIAANEMSYSHIVISIVYASLQLIINVLLMQAHNVLWLIILAIALLGFYTYTKSVVYNKIAVKNAPPH